MITQTVAQADTLPNQHRNSPQPGAWTSGWQRVDRLSPVS
jgi:hypothetical protein